MFLWPDFGSLGMGREYPNSEKLKTLQMAPKRPSGSNQLAKSIIDIPLMPFSTFQRVAESPKSTATLAAERNVSESLQSLGALLGRSTSDAP